jgi:hypothetical protein
MRISLEQALDILMDHVTGKNRKKTFGTMSGAGTFAGCICVT